MEFAERHGIKILRIFIERGESATAADRTEFIKAIELANITARELDKIVEIGVRPTFPSIALGYLKVGKMIKDIDGLGIFEFVEQIEKPSLIPAV